MPKKLTQKEYEYRVEQINKDIKVLGEYNGSNKKILHKCKRCGHEWLVTPQSILRQKSGCPKCAYADRAQKRALTNDEYVNRVNIVMPNIKVIDDYISSGTPIKHMCKVCGYGSNGEWSPTPSHVMNGHGCPVCSGNIIGSAPDYKNSIWYQKKYYNYFKDYITEEQMKSYMPNSHEKIKMKCPVCGREKNISPNTLWRQGFGCVCNDGVSYPNKFMLSFLEQAGVDFIRETSFDWSDGRIYDFYIPSYDCIIECHGMQHYRGWNNNYGDAIKQEINDNQKYHMAINNGISKNRYVIVDCRVSDKSYIKNSIYNSGLLNILDVDIASINIDKCHVFALSNFVKTACNMWNSGMSIGEIQNKMNVVAVWNYLKAGKEIGWCKNYTKTEARNRGFNNTHNNRKLSQVYCQETNEVFVSISYAGRCKNINQNSIYLCCIGKQKTCHKEHWYYLHDHTLKDGSVIQGAISRGFISYEDAMKQLDDYEKLKDNTY